MSVSTVPNMAERSRPSVPRMVMQAMAISPMSRPYSTIEAPSSFCPCNVEIRLHNLPCNWFIEGSSEAEHVSRANGLYDQAVLPTRSPFRHAERDRPHLAMCHRYEAAVTLP